METTKTIKAAMQKAKEKYITHVNDCEICQYSPEIAEDEINCYGATFLYDEWQGLQDKLDYADRVFEQELKERNFK